MRRLLILPVALLALLLSGCAAQRPRTRSCYRGRRTAAGRGAARQGRRLPLLNGAWTRCRSRSTSGRWSTSARSTTSPPNGVRVLTYTDPGTFAGAGPRPNVDAERRDRLHGDRRAAPGSGRARTRPNVVAGIGRADPDPRHRSATRPTPTSTCSGRPAASTRAPGAATSTTASTCSPATTRRTYKLNDGPNPEDSTVTTAFYTPALLRPLGRRRAEDRGPRAPPASTSSTATRTSSRPATAAAARTRSTTPRARSSSTRAARCARSAPTSAPTAGR